jgi:hypothetical protein
MHQSGSGAKVFCDAAPRTRFSAREIMNLPQRTKAAGQTLFMGYRAVQQRAGWPARHGVVFREQSR